MPRSKLPVLRHRDDLKIPAPCAEDFDEMTPDGSGRMCASCCSVVHDMSAMTEREAARFLAARRGQPTCVHFNLRPDGSIVYRREPHPLAPVMAVALAACTPHGPPQERALDVGDPLPTSTPVMMPTVVPPATTPATTPTVKPQAELPLPEPCAAKAGDPAKQKPTKKQKFADAVDGMLEW